MGISEFTAEHTSRMIMADVVEPPSTPNIGLQAAVESGGCSVSQNNDSEKRCCSVPDHGFDSLEVEVGNRIEPCLTNCEVMDAFRGDPVNIEKCNVSSVRLGLSQMCFDEPVDKSEINPCSSHQMDSLNEGQMDSSHGRQVASEVIPVACALVGSTSQNEGDHESPSIKSLVEVGSNITLSRAVDDEYPKGLLMPDEVKLDIATDVVDISIDAQKEGRTQNNTCEYPDGPSLPLRRSSRARKSFQEVQGGKRLTKSSKKASKLALGKNVDLLSKATTKKRSSKSRSLCSSSWGSSANLSKYFKLSSEVDINKLSTQGLKKGKAAGKSRKKKEPKVVAIPKLSGGGQEVALRPIRLKVTFGKKEDKLKVDAIPLQSDALSGLPLGNDSHQPDLCSYTGSTGMSSLDDSVRKETILKRCNYSAENQITGAELETCSTMEKSNTDSIPVEFEKLSTVNADKYVDPGTSPDSEVIDQVLDSTTALNASTVILKPENITLLGATDTGIESSQLPPKKNKKKRNKKDKVSEAGVPDMEGKLLCQTSTNKAEVSKKKGEKQQEKSGFCTADAGVTAHSENPSSNTCCSDLISTELLPNFEEGPHSSLINGVDSNIVSGIGVGIESADSGNSCPSPPPEKSCRNRNSMCSKTKVKSRIKSNVTDATRKKKNCSGQSKIGRRKLMSNCKVDKDILDEGYNNGRQFEAAMRGKLVIADVGKTDAGSGLARENVSCDTVVPTEFREHALPPRVAWVCCDDCQKWRCIPSDLADVIEATDSSWTCKDNLDQAFADCSIPQEKSNAAINAELQISDEEDAHLGSKAIGVNNAIGSQSSSWMLVKSNLYLHRSRKTQTMDEIMVCGCKLPAESGMGCGSHCLNRMLNIECVQGTCPCGNRCSNQRFQRQQYAKLSWFRCGKKGYGLQVLEDISEGQFLIEYVGEVLDLQAYEARQKEYASKGHKHFYFMTLNGNEVIDACVKGNLGRFVNHSCEPNCRTEKWVVNGEICVGLFAERNIKKGEELTFDYNYVRVFGAAAKRCHCGSDKCRGYIGGDPHNAEIIVQGDSDEDFPEPVLVNESGEIDHTINDTEGIIKSEDVELGPNANIICEESVKDILEGGENTNEMQKSPIELGGPLPSSAKKEAIDETLECSDTLTASLTEVVKNGALSTATPLTSTTEQTINTSTSLTISDGLLMKRMVKDSHSGSIDSSGKISEVDNIECDRPPPKSRPRMKISRPFKSSKQRKAISNANGVEKALVMTHKSQLAYRPKKLLEASSSFHLEAVDAVEAKLNELLDSDGGICKRKDASKGYLKLLLLTAASGDSCNGGAIQSNRDLSMILDAILKTKSRGVLLDVINKNGLQMLHNMMKLYRKDFKKIPILRKLLKVFEFLAERVILTVERINGDRIHPGVESFRESVLSFTEHDDRKVHQIARNFRDRWIRRPIRKVNGMEKTDRKREFNRSSKYSRSFETHHYWQDHGVRPTEPMDFSNELVLPQNLADTQMQEASPSKICDSQPVLIGRRKRKSRWDQDASPKKSKEHRSTSPQTIKTSPIAEISSEINIKVEDDDTPPGFAAPPCEDAPPGFTLQKSEDVSPALPSSPSPKCSSVTEAPSVVYTAHLQERFNSHLPVAYGIPFAMMQQLGTLQLGTVDSWDIAPAMPFQPFPPLPPYPRNTRDVPQASTDDGVMRNGHSFCDQGIPSTSGTSVHPHNLPHERGFSNKLGRRYYRQRKWNNMDNRAPRLRKRFGWGFKGNHPRNGIGNFNMDTISNEQYCQHLADVNHSVDCAGNSC